MANLEECINCEGWGWLNSDVTDICPDCDGKGSVDLEEIADGK